jgi:energy-converting hydrogenase Eha subunit G
MRGGGCRGGVRVAGCSGAFYMGERRSRGSGIVEIHYEPFWEGISQVVGSDEG